jgi:hypothetical protein
MLSSTRHRDREALMKPLTLLVAVFVINVHAAVAGPASAGPQRPQKPASVGPVAEPAIVAARRRETPPLP